MCYENEEKTMEHAKEVWPEKRMDQVTEAMEDLIMGVMLSALEKIKARDICRDPEGDSTGMDRQIPF